MPYNEFKDIFRSLFNGNVSQIENLTENYSDEYTVSEFDIFAEEWEKAQIHRNEYAYNVVSKTKKKIHTNY